MAQLSIIELITRKTSVALMIPEDIVEQVIRHKHMSVHAAQYLHNTVEDSGLGTFKVRIKVAIKRIEKLDKDISWLLNQIQDGNISETDKEKFKRRIEILKEEKKYVESKI